MMPYEILQSPLITDNALLIHQAFHLQMFWVLTTTFGTMGGQILNAAEQGDTLKECHFLPTCVFASPTNNHFWGSCVRVDGAFCDLVGTTTCGAPVVLLLPRALRHYMPYFLAPKALDNPAAVQVITMEDGHFYCSPGSGWEWDDGPNNSRCLDKGGLDW